MRIFSINTFILTLGIAGAFFLPGKADARPVTTAVFQDHDGTPCRITLEGGERSVQCHIRGIWQDRQARAAAQRAQDKSTSALPVQRARTAPVITDPDIVDIARAAELAVQDVQLVLAEFNRPTVEVAFRDFKR